MSNDDLYQKLLGLTLSYVSIRLRSEQELRQFITKKVKKWNAQDVLLEQVMERMKELGYIDDLRYSLTFIDSRNRFRPKGKFVIKKELLRKGISEIVIEEAFNCVRQGGDGSIGSEINLARHAAEKKLRSLQRYTVKDRKTKLFTFLVRRGFPFETATQVIDEMIPKGLQ